jgi:hypothetical protein
MSCYLLGKHFLAFVDVDLQVTDILSTKIVIYSCVCARVASQKVILP